MNKNMLEGFLTQMSKFAAHQKEAGWKTRMGALGLGAGGLGALALARPDLIQKLIHTIRGSEAPPAIMGGLPGPEGGVTEWLQSLKSDKQLGPSGTELPERSERGSLSSSSFHQIPR